MNVWDTLSGELDAWAAAGRTAEFWWRDDDAIDTTPALTRLFELRRRLAVPIALAVIPANAQRRLADAIAKQEAVDVLQHGYAHTNHRDCSAKKAELGADRDLWDIARELADGRGRMVDLFGDTGWLDVMVPPWNRIDDSVGAVLPGLGFHGLTTFNARRATEAAPGLRVVNTHIDIIDWPGTRGYAGDDATIGAALSHLSDKRAGRSDADEPTGLLSHHLAHDEACWAFIEKFVSSTSAHPAVVWRSAKSVFPVPEFSQPA